MNYHVVLKRSAEKELNRLHGELFERIQRKLLSLADNPRPVGIQKLQGEDTYRLRVGDYRILCLIDDTAKRIEIISVAHRREAYR